MTRIATTHRPLVSLSLSLFLFISPFFFSYFLFLFKSLDLCVNEPVQYFSNFSFSDFRFQSMRFIFPQSFTDICKYIWHITFTHTYKISLSVANYKQKKIKKKDSAEENSFPCHPRMFVGVVVGFADSKTNLHLSMTTFAHLHVGGL
uniref:Uncharacterized protein n=1 Tax=Octopus bimaculoides TaxID=37653 RepID=A0A0L8HZA5_OCTBM